MELVIIAVLATLLAVSGEGNYLQKRSREHFEAYWMTRERRALDMAHAAELRSHEQIDAMLDRINTSPRIEVRPPLAPKVDLAERTYIADHDVAAWNEHVGEPVEEQPKDEDLEALRDAMHAQGDAR